MQGNSQGIHKVERGRVGYKGVFSTSVHYGGFWIIKRKAYVNKDRGMVEQT